MAKYTTNEYSILAGKSESTIRKHIQRGKLIKDSDGYIDAEHPINKVYETTIANGLGIKLRFARMSKDSKCILININLYTPEELAKFY